MKSIFFRFSWSPAFYVVRSVRQRLPSLWTSFFVQGRGLHSHYTLEVSTACPQKLPGSRSTQIRNGLSCNYHEFQGFLLLNFTGCNRSWSCPKDPCMVYLPTLIPQRSTIHVGKYTIPGSYGMFMAWSNPYLRMNHVWLSWSGLECGFQVGTWSGKYPTNLTIPKTQSFQWPEPWIIQSIYIIYVCIYIYRLFHKPWKFLHPGT